MDGRNNLQINFIWELRSETDIDYFVIKSHVLENKRKVF